jgi:hypothetical protein
MGRYKQQDARAKHKRPEAHGEYGRPAQTSPAGFSFELPDPFGQWHFNQARVHPALKVFFPAHDLPR